MKIDNKSNPNAMIGKNLDTGRATKSEKATVGSAGLNNANALNAKTATKNADVNLSERAQMMAKAKDIASKPMGIDEAKVARLQKLIDDGQYKTDSKAIADRLVEEHMTIPD
jgi:flagellar biosynthesis anti-sigma factor FlgM